MAYIANFDASNRADFVVEFSATDADTGDDIDFTGFDIAFKIADDCATVIEATTANGLIILPTSTVLQLTIPASRMAALWPKTYQIGAVFEFNGETTQLLVGSFVVYDGVASV